MTAKIIVTCVLGLFVACATLSEPPPRTPAEAARAAVNARKDADNAATGACLAYRAGVLTGILQPDEATEAACDSILPPPPPECPAPDEPEPATEGPEMREVPA